MSETHPPQPRLARRYGWKPDVPDARDLVMKVARVPKTPAKLSLRAKMPPVYDQGQLGSCTANAIAACHQYQQLTQQLAQSFQPSRLFIYYNERKMEHTIESDAGAMIRDGIKSVNKQGVCPEPDCPYDISRFKLAPSAANYDEASHHKVTAYMRVPRVASQMEAVLATGKPIVVGISVYESFESDAVAKTGKVPMPKKTEQLLGGHAVVVVGYDRTKKLWECRNSWGESWGMQGYFTLPYEYLTDPNLSDDFWVIQVVAA